MAAAWLLRRTLTRPNSAAVMALGTQAFPARSVSDFVQKLGRRGRFAKNVYAATAAILGILLWGSALLDWAGYTRFVLSLMRF